ncbi:Hypothetical predicted protein [Octopus vulgaris]|uniref:Nocturnin n=2 Tax=Octopus vulgaris TaxID=6645 RepID=A0AA36BCW9_OCTVU|nr:Hypothetical predicted protein [Octopus vulgaris]
MLKKRPKLPKDNGTIFHKEALTKIKRFADDLEVLIMPDSHDKCQELLKKIQDECKSKGLPDFMKREFTMLPATTEQNSSNIPKIRLLQWNVLAQALSVGTDNFILCPMSALSWDTRKLRILEGILNNNPDVICLEEVDHYDYLSSHLTSVGYSGIFQPKPDSPCLYLSNSMGPDGCALFYRKDYLKLLDFQKIGLKRKDGQLMNQVAIHCLLKIISGAEEGKDKFSVIVTHLKAKEGFEKLRYEEGNFILEYIHENVKSWPVIVCGDFNADPMEEVYKSFSKSDLKLFSAYTKLSDEGSEPSYTTWKVRDSPTGPVEICRTIDYIWCSQKSLEILSLLDLPKDEDVGQNRLPSHSYPSDHLSLVCDFQLI